MEDKRGHVKAGPKGVELFSQLAQCTAHDIQQFDHAACTTKSILQEKDPVASGKSTPGVQVG